MGHFFAGGRGTSLIEKAEFPARNRGSASLWNVSAVVGEFLEMAVWLCGYTSNISYHKNGWFQHKTIREICSSCWQKHHFVHELIPWYHGEGLSEPVVLSHRYWVGSPWTSSGNLSWQDRRSMESRISHDIFRWHWHFPASCVASFPCTCKTPSLPSYQPMSSHTSQQDTPYQSNLPLKNKTYYKLISN